MEFDDPQKPEFSSWQSYNEFASHVCNQRRYVFDKKIESFLRTVLATVKNRDVQIPIGKILYRAQMGIHYENTYNEDGIEIGEEWLGYPAQRMKPLLNRAKEGRVNPVGIPSLYLASRAETAISEVRPWIGSKISVAQFKIVRNLRCIDLSLGHGTSSFNYVFPHIFNGETLSADLKEKVVWTDIDNAFSQPVTLSDDMADYVPTQILAELFKEAEYDAVVYRSQFGENGYNIALFKAEDADPINCAPYEITALNISYKEIGNTWFSRKHLESKKVEP